MTATPADHSFHFDPSDDPCPSCDTQMAGELNCPNCMLEHPDRYYEVNDEMIERAWAAIVGFDVAGQCFVASLTRADLRAGIVSALAFANRRALSLSQAKSDLGGSPK